MRELIKKPSLIVLILLLIGAFLRFYNLSWGAPFYFHPDERNIASAVSQLEFPNQLNPKFFAYGSLPIYSIFTVGFIKNLIFHCLPNFQNCLPTASANFSFINISVWQKVNSVTFGDAIIISRIFSAAFSAMLIFLIYIAGKKLHSVFAGLLAALLTTTSVGLIQFSHFGTFEMWLTFFSVILFILCIKIIHNFKSRYIIYCGLVLGVLISVKISHLSLFPIPIICISHSLFKDIRSNSKLKNRIKVFFEFTAQISLLIIIASLVFIITNPFSFLDFKEFKNSMNYETGVALGTTEVFYTHEFFDTIPIIFHFSRVYPFLLNPLITILFIPALFYIAFCGIKTKNIKYILLTTFYLLLFLSQAFLFVKWTRYMVPTLPFVYMIIAITLVDLLKQVKAVSSIKYQVLSVISIVSLLFTYSYYVTVLASEDSRVEAALWAKKNIDRNSKIISETYDLGIIAFNSSFSNIALCDMYYLEKNQYPCNGFPLNETLKQADYIIIPSERLLKMSIVHKDKFPKRFHFYGSLLQNKSNFKLIYKTDCDIFCEILYMGNTFYPFEQTTHIFERPTVYIFKKSK